MLCISHLCTFHFCPGSGYTDINRYQIQRGNYENKENPLTIMYISETQHPRLSYAKMGYFDKATVRASKQNSLLMSREVLLSLANEGETRDKYQGEAIIEVLIALKTVIVNSVCTKVSVFTKKEGVALMIELAHLFEAVFSDGRCGVGHYHICELYLHAALYEARFGEGAEKALEHFKKGFTHKKIYESIRYTGEYRYTAPLVTKVAFPSDNFPSLSKAFWKGWIEVLPDELIERIKSDAEYAECFIKN